MLQTPSPMMQVYARSLSCEIVEGGDWTDDVWSAFHVDGREVIIKRHSVTEECDFTAQWYLTASKAGVSCPKVINTNGPLMALEKLPGQSLHRWYDEWTGRRWSLSLKERINAWELIFAQLQLMWSAGIKHGDLHANNIILTRDRCWIIDPGWELEFEEVDDLIRIGEFAAERDTIALAKACEVFSKMTGDSIHVWRASLDEA
jgi:hypothetical protein